MALTFQPIFAANIGTTVTDVYTAPAGGATIARIYLSNKTASTVNASVSYLNPDNGTTVYQIKSVLLPAGYTFEIKPAQPLKAGGKLKVSSSASNSVDVTGSVTPVQIASPLMVQGIGTAVSNIYTAAANGKALLRLYLANTTASTVTANIQYFDSSASITPYQVKDVLVPVGNTLAIEPVQALDMGDVVKISASADNSLDLTGCVTL